MKRNANNVVVGFVSGLNISLCEEGSALGSFQVLNIMDESMEPGPSRCDPNIDLPSTDVPPENELKEIRKKGLEKA
ncbi:unnamed protein product [Bursaphelenchus xylophilus]|uniref:(pine wood nematode) hypothetical protein n=1 Tax=Bursaphelenchus xylophilus TaxID=6326 RepID=A0A1I7S7K2_BURXY|nr:unnamed protein product [Bursaphelenchus xylophilus]CAG9111917.1 unnamed protein product [Bursaphelenchus xylophilus]